LTIPTYLAQSSNDRALGFMNRHTPVLLIKPATKLAVKVNNADKCAYFLIRTYFLEIFCRYTADINASIM